MESVSGFEEFVAIVEAGSVTGAADQLGLPRPTVSRRLAKLEERLEVRLLHRTTRRLTLTPQGEVLYTKARHVVQSAREATAAVRRVDGVPRGRLRVSIPTAMPQALFAGWMAAFLARYPEVQLEIIAKQGPLDLVAEGFDVAFHRGEVRDTSLVARNLTSDDTVAVASPRYLAQSTPLKRVDHLARHSCIVGVGPRSVPDVEWPLLDGGVVRVPASMAASELPLRGEAAKNHLGVALVSHNVVRPDLESGALTHVLPRRVGRRERVRLVYRDREFMEPKVRAFVDFIAARVAETRSTSRRTSQ